MRFVGFSIVCLSGIFVFGAIGLFSSWLLMGQMSVQVASKFAVIGGFMGAVLFALLSRKPEEPPKN